MNTFTLRLIGAALLLLSPCIHATQTGYFIDAPVTGLYYQTNSGLSGFTDKGAYQYKDGDVVSFYLGQSNQDFLLARLSTQPVLTPNHASTKPARSINMTRLLMSLDTAPEKRNEIVLASRLLSDVNVQRQLKSIDLNFLEQSIETLGIPLISKAQAVEHLSQSHEYIQKNFASQDVIFKPLGIELMNIMVKKRDHYGRLCAYDLKKKTNPNYNPPIGEITYKITPTQIIQMPSLGDHFRGCQRTHRGRITSTISEDLANVSEAIGMIGCAQTGCTQSDLNGFSLEDFNDEGDHKYRSFAINFDPHTQLLMEKVQGLGPSEKVRHSNRAEMIWFTYPATHHQQIAYEGTWRHTLYHSESIEHQCLQIRHGKVWQGPQQSECPTQANHYQQDVSAQFSDMWWVNATSSTAELAQLNMMVRWYDAAHQPQLTTWEYLPAGKAWDQGILYRYQHHNLRSTPQGEQVDTFQISEFVKVTGESS